MSAFSFLNQRPLAITAVCVVGIINATQMISLIMSPMAKQLGAFYPFYFTVSVPLSLACLIGLWFLKRWAALVYGLTLLCNQTVLMNMGFWEPSAAVIPAAMIGVLLKYFNRMR